jgi:hypothetical protein
MAQLQVKTLTLTNMGTQITLQGVQQTQNIAIQELAVEQLVKWSKGNEVWAMAVLHPEDSETVTTPPAEIQTVLEQFQEVINSYVTDAEAQLCLTELAVTSPDEQGYALHQGIIRLHGRVWVGSNSTLKTKLLTAFHSSAVGGHSGADATY